MEWMSNYIPLFYVDVITDPSIKEKGQLAYQCKSRYDRHTHMQKLRSYIIDDLAQDCSNSYCSFALSHQYYCPFSLKVLTIDTSQLTCEGEMWGVMA